MEGHIMIALMIVEPEISGKGRFESSRMGSSISHCEFRYLHYRYPKTRF